MKAEKTKLQDALLFTPDIFGDRRGYFFESYSKEKFKPFFGNEFVQDNQSFSKEKGVIRGLHCQAGIHSQAKLVRVISGTVEDFFVDVRKGSPTYLKWDSVILSGENNKQLYIPKGFLHGFVTLTSDVLFAYKVDEYYFKESERGVLYSDSLFGINWHVQNPVLSDKDMKNPLFSEANILFTYEDYL